MTMFFWEKVNERQPKVFANPTKKQAGDRGRKPILYGTGTLKSIIK